MVPCNKSPSVSGLILGPLIVGNSHVTKQLRAAVGPLLGTLDLIG